MTKYIILGFIVAMLSGCATWNDGNNLDYYLQINERAKNPVAPTGDNFGELFACYLKHSAYFNDADVRYICN